MTHEELLAKIEGLEQIMQAQGMMFTMHSQTCSMFQQMVIKELNLDDSR